MTDDLARAKAREHGCSSEGRTLVELVRAIQVYEGFEPCFATARSNACRETACCWRESCTARVLGSVEPLSAERTSELAWAR